MRRYQVRLGPLVTIGAPHPIECCDHKHKSIRTAVKCMRSWISPSGNYPENLCIMAVEGEVNSQLTEDERQEEHWARQ